MSPRSNELVYALAAIAAIVIYLETENWMWSVVLLVVILVAFQFGKTLLPFSQNATHGNPNFQSFLCRCGGAIPSILREYCPHEIPKYSTIGLTIVFTAILASFSGGYAMLQVFGNYYWAITLGLLWGMIILNLDTMMVMSIRKSDPFWRQSVQAIPRLGLAIIIGFVISKPIEIRMFEDRLAAEINSTKQQKDSIAQQQNEVLSGKSENEKLMAQNERVRDSLNRVWNEPTTPDYQRLRRVSDEAQRRYNQAIAFQGEVNQLSRKIERLKTDFPNTSASPELEALQNRYNTLVFQIEQTRTSKNKTSADLQSYLAVYRRQIETYRATTEINIQNLGPQLEASKRDADLRTRASYQANDKAFGNANNFIAQIEALGFFIQREPVMRWTSYMLTLLFILIEIAPVLVKLMSHKGEFDNIMEQKNLESSYLLQAEKINKQRHIEILKQGAINEYKMEQLRQDETIARKHQEASGYHSFQQQQIEAQEEVIRLTLQRWKEEKIKEMENQKGNESFSHFIEVIKKAFRHKSNTSS